jgi:hypothetical protein
MNPAFLREAHCTTIGTFISHGFYCWALAGSRLFADGVDASTGTGSHLTRPYSSESV